MKAERLEKFRICLLRSLAKASPYSLPEEELQIGASFTGFRDVEMHDVKTELYYLADKKFIEEDRKAISPEVRKWRIKAEGRDFLAEQGLS